MIPVTPVEPVFNPPRHLTAFAYPTKACICNTFVYDETSWTGLRYKATGEVAGRQTSFRFGPTVFFNGQLYSVLLLIWIMHGNTPPGEGQALGIKDKDYSVITKERITLFAIS